MIEPLKQFFCDTCGLLIENPDDGWVEWINYYDEQSKKSISKNFRICHHQMSCQKLADKPNCSDVPLREFIGEMAIVQLTRFLDIGPYHQKNYNGPEVENLREFTEFMRRLTLPYYEEARQYWSRAMSDGFFSDANEIYIYLPRNLKNMVEHYENN